MQAISDLMTRDVSVISPDDTVQHAAQLMRDQDIGSLPVCTGKRLVGMLTDRDVTIRAVASGKAPADIKVSDAMSDQVLWCFEDQTAGEVLQQMGDQQIRRIPVISRSMELVGMISLGDLARHREHTDKALEEISSPAPPIHAPTGRQPTTRP
jgi:CBS domain-containing protein